MKRILRRCVAGMLALGFVTTAWAQPAPWLERTPIDVHNASAMELVDHQVRLEIDTASLIAAGRLQADGDDLRFGLDIDGVTPIPYWLESGIDSATTVVWIAVPSIPAESHVAVWMYFNNPVAASESALDAVFPPSALERDDSSTLQVDSGGAGGVTNSQRGFRFQPNDDVLVVSFGKREPTGTERYITLFDNATQAIIHQQQIAGPAAVYSYAELPEPIWLRAGQQYILQMYQGNTDGYYFGSSTQIHPKLTYFDMRYCNGCTENTFPTNWLNAIHYGYPDMLLRWRKEASPQPTGIVGDVPSEVVVSADADPSLFGDDVVFTAQVDASLDVEGTVTFQADGVDLCVDVVLLGGEAQCTASGLAVGSHTIDALYSGGLLVLPGSGSVAHEVHILPPGAPTALVATQGDMQLSIDMQPPEFIGGSPITVYTVTCADGINPHAIGTAATPPVVVSGLVNGNLYLCDAFATNDAGIGATSEQVQGSPGRVPDAPTALQAVAGSEQATLTFVAPDDTGGFPILGYTALCSAGGNTVETDGSASPMLVTGLTNGVEYMCTVQAYNAVGSSAPSDSATVFPQGVPGAPVALTALAGDMQATLFFGAPLTDGGSPITQYRATCAVGSTTTANVGTTSPIALGLINHATYRCSVVAINAFGEGPPSNEISVTPPDDVLLLDGFEPIETP